MAKINKKIFILLIAVLSFTSFAVGVKAEISGGSGNVNVGSGSSGGGSDPNNDLKMDRQILKLRVFGSNNVVKKTGYIALKGGTASIGATVCSNNSESDTVLFLGDWRGTIKDAANAFSCRWQSISVSSIGDYSGDAWNFDGANAGNVANWVENGEYSNLIKMLDAIGYKDYANGDYVIIEPFVKITCSRVETFGTITGLLATNNAISNADPISNRCSNTNLRQVLSRIAVAFKVNSSVTCLTGITYDRILGYYDKYATLPFQGCGYNRYNISDIIRKGNLTLEKVNTSGTLIRGKSVSVKVCKAGSNSCIYKTFYGSTTISDLDVGTYYIYETQAPVGYYIPNNNYYVGSVNVTSGSPVPFKITNKNECEYKFDSLPNKNSMTQRINLFLEFLGRNPSKKYTNLLNLDMRQGKDACKNAMCIDSYISGCLSSQKGPNSTFNERNLSCYESKMGSKNTPIFCKSNYTFYSRISYKGNIGTSYNYYGTSINFGNFKSGRMVLNFDEANRKIAEGTLTVTCYVAGTNRGNEAEKLNFNYHDYVNKVCLYNETDNSCNTETNYLVEDNLQSNISNTPVGSELVKHTTILKYDYLLRPIYGKYGSGELTYDKINSRLLGYGIISKFSDGNIANSENKLKFEIPSLRVSNTSCTYNVEQEVVELDCPNGNCDGDNTSWELNLAFRQISKLNPFPGKSGSGRKVGTNWCDGDNCNNDNKIVKETITDKNDSYNSTGDGPKYIINLNSKTIQEIKEKYKGQAYDDFGESCDTPDGTCASDFIKWMSDEGMFQEKIIEEG